MQLLRDAWGWAAPIFTRRRVVVGLSVLAVLAVVYFGVAWYVLGEALTAERNPFDHQPEDFNLTFEDIEFSPRGEPDITLRGWIFPTEGALATIIWVHGLDKNRAARLSMMRELVDAGFAVLVFDLRGHGESDDVPIGAGFFEMADVRGGIDFLLSERGVKPGKILLMGESLGAATVLMAGVGESAVVGVYADSGFASLSDVMIGEIAKRTPIPEWGASYSGPGSCSWGSGSRAWRSTRSSRWRRQLSMTIR
jgi:pimeloyl-ACP methyl ester carboxylesterase